MANKPGRDQEWARSLVLVSQLGLTFSMPIVFGALAGRALDERLGTSPWLLLILLLAGVAAGVVASYRVLAKVLDWDR